MNRRSNTFVLFLLPFLLSVIPLLLSGQTVSETNFSGVVGAGARAFGMGGAFIAIADDATAASWNPAGLGQLERPEVTLVLRFQNYRNISPAIGDGMSFYYGAEEQIGSSGGFDFIALSYPLRIGKFKIVPQISYQRAINYDIEFTKNDVQTYFQDSHPFLHIPVAIQGSFSEGQAYKGGVDVVSFSVGSRFFDWLNLGISANVWMNGYEGELKLTLSGDVYNPANSTFFERVNMSMTERLTVAIRGVNFNLGILVDVSEKLKIGGVYKSSFSGEDAYSFAITEEGNWGNIFYGGDEFHKNISGNALLKWPETFGVGAAFRPIDPLTVSFDVTITRWSTAIMKDFPLADEEAGSISNQDVYFPTIEPVTNENGFRQLDTHQFRLGVEYVLIGRKTLVPLRLGFFADSQYYPDSSGKRVNFFGITTGVGIKRGGFGIDFAALLETGGYFRSNFSYSANRFTEVKAYLSTSYSF
jgi:hypothetical protein